MPRVGVGAFGTCAHRVLSCPIFARTADAVYRFGGELPPFGGSKRFQRSVLGGIAGNAGVFSCLEDMTTFADFLSEECAPLLTKGLFRQAVSDQTKAFSIHRGLGFHLLPGDNPFTGNLFPKGCYGHTGFTGTSCFVEHHTGRYAVLLTNRVYYGKENQRLVRFRWLLHQAVRNAFR